MPTVTLTFSDGSHSQAGGGCFGFCGRSHLSGFNHDQEWLRRSRNNSITNFVYHVGEILGDAFTDLKDPKPYLNWLASDSPWAKYVVEVRNITGTCEDAEVEIRTDIPGHCVIGTASAFRFAGKQHGLFLKYFNLALQMGSNPAIAFLVYYATKSAVSYDLSTDPRKTKEIRHGRITQNPTAKVGLGDDEVVNLSMTTPSDIYAFISGDFEMIREDTARETLFSQTGGYEQNILNSFMRSNYPERQLLNLGKWLVQRFPNTLTALDEYTVSVSNSMSGQTTMVGTDPGQHLVSTLGWVSTLCSEFALYNRFLGLPR